MTQTQTQTRCSREYNYTTATQAPRRAKHALCYAGKVQWFTRRSAADRALQSLPHCYRQDASISDL